MTRRRADGCRSLRLARTAVLVARSAVLIASSGECRPVQFVSGCLRAFVNVGVSVLLRYRPSVGSSAFSAGEVRSQIIGSPTAAVRF